ncbi:cyclin-B1-2-like [Corylus avellana]|uniref:cyclin-B1-2-like n=1 Tax=Corylus avellana TaxID=13451 RepID=UPI00286ABF7A|nr:cyclin-B1-2-like [Corylus avellana]
MTQKKLQHRVEEEEEEEEDNSAYGFYKRLERQSRVMKSNLTDNVRAIMVDWLTEVHAFLGYGPETLFLAVNVVDRFVSLSLEVLSMAELKLLGMAALVIAFSLSPLYPNYMLLIEYLVIWGMREDF